MKEIIVLNILIRRNKVENGFKISKKSQNLSLATAVGASALENGRARAERRKWGFGHCRGRDRAQKRALSRQTAKTFGLGRDRALFTRGRAVNSACTIFFIFIFIFWIIFIIFAKSFVKYMILNSKPKYFFKIKGSV